MMSDAQKTAFKQSVKQACIELLEQRCSNAQIAMQQAQDSANNEEKSSAGDKYETARAMGQSNRDMNARQLHEAQKDLTFLNSLNTSALHSSVTTGSVISISDTFLFIAIGLGPVKVGDITVMVVSYKSPLFEQLRHKTAGSTILFQNREQTISNVF